MIHLFEDLKMFEVRSQDHPEYEFGKTEKENATIEKALQILKSRIKERGDFMEKPADVENFLKIQFSEMEYEAFSVIFLDNQHRLIAFEEMFKGTINGSSVHPREVMKAALKHNAAAVILSHNHPSGIATPSSADKQITKILVDAMELIDVRILDHIIIGDGDSFKFSEAGYI